MSRVHTAAAMSWAMVGLFLSAGMARTEIISYTYTPIATTASGPFFTFVVSPSINNSGMVAFSAILNTGAGDLPRGRRATHHYRHHQRGHQWPGV